MRLYTSKFFNYADIEYLKVNNIRLILHILILLGHKFMKRIQIDLFVV